MSSGWSVNGGVSRCYPLFHQFRHCLSSAGHPSECQAEVLDYLDCVSGRRSEDHWEKVKDWCEKRIEDPAVSEEEKGRLRGMSKAGFLRKFRVAEFAKNDAKQYTGDEGQ